MMNRTLSLLLAFLLAAPQPVFAALSERDKAEIGAEADLLKGLGTGESGAAGWKCYSNTAQATPVTGTGGTANVTMAGTTTDPIEGSGSLLFTKDAVNRQGQGCAIDIAVPPANRARMNQITGDVQSVSGTFAEGDVKLFLYDKTNSQVLTPMNNGFSVSSLVLPIGPAEVFIPHNTAQLRVILHVTTTSASAYSFKLDRLKLSLPVKATGAPVVDEASYTPTITNLGTVTSLVARRSSVGDRLHVSFRFVTGTASSGAVTMSLPTGLAVAAGSGSTIRGAGWSQGTTKNFFVSAGAGASTVQFIASSGGGGALTGTDFGSSQIVDGYFSVPIQGWSSNMQLGVDARRPVHFRASNSNSVVNVGTWTKAVAMTPSLDTVAAWDGPNNRYVVKVPGTYRVNGAAGFGTFATSGRGATAAIYINGVSAPFAEIAASTASLTSVPVGWLGNLKVGDYIELFANHNDSAQKILNSMTYLEIECTTCGGQTIAAADLAVQSGNTTSGERSERALIGGGGGANTNCSTSPCTIAYQSGSWLTSVTRTGTGVYAVSFATGTFQGPPSCTCSAVTYGTAPRLCATGFHSTTGVNVEVHTGSGYADGGFSLRCQGPR